MAKKKVKEQVVKIAFIHFDSEGKMTQLEDLKNINWIENGDKQLTKLKAEISELKSKNKNESNEFKVNRTFYATFYKTIIILIFK